MADDTTPGSTPAPFDVGTVAELVRLMAAHELNEIDLRDGPRRIVLRKGFPAAAMQAAPAAPAPQYQPAPVAHPPGSPAEAPASPRKWLEIRSSGVGTFYAKPAPDKDDYVKVGSRVQEDTVVCKIEAMKTFTDMPAGVAGVIMEVVARDATFVEFDDVLFRVDPG